MVNQAIINHPLLLPQEWTDINAQYGWPPDPVWTEADWTLDTPTVTVYMAEARSVQVCGEGNGREKMCGVDWTLGTLPLSREHGRGEGVAGEGTRQTHRCPLPLPPCHCTGCSTGFGA